MASKPTVLDGKGMADALDLPAAMKDVQDSYWQARRDWIELQNAYLTVLEHMATIHRNDE